MSVFDIFKNTLFNEADEFNLDGGEEEELPLGDGGEELPAEEPVDELPAEEEGGEEPSSDTLGGDPKKIVDTLIANAPGKGAAIGSMLKYAANSNPEYDIFDASLDYYDSVADEVDNAKEEIADEEPVDDLPVEELPADEPVDELPADDDEEISLA